MIKENLKIILLVPVRILLVMGKSYIAIVTFLTRRWWAAEYNEILTQARVDKIVAIQGTCVRLWVANTISRMRVRTLLFKEPELIDWLDGHCDKPVLWDIGANIGGYSVYFSGKYRKRTVAFEPMFENLLQLSRNIQLNQLENLVTIVPMPLSDNDGTGFFRILNDGIGAADNQFCEAADIEASTDGTSFGERSPGYSVLGLNGGSALTLLGCGPSIVKIDVDGTELQVLRGLAPVLKSEDCLSLYIEVAKSDVRSKEAIADVLKGAGFAFSNEFEHKATVNQIWDKKELRH